MLDGDRAAGALDGAASSRASIDRARGRRLRVAGDPAAQRDRPAERGLPVGEGLDRPRRRRAGLGARPPALQARDGRASRPSTPLFMAQVTVGARSAVVRRRRLGPVPLPGRSMPGYEISAAVFAMKPRSRGRGRRSSAATREAPLAIDHGFLSDRARRRRRSPRGSRRLRALARRRPRARATPRAKLRPGAAVDALEPRTRRARAASSIRSGPARSGAWSTTTGRVLGVDGLAVADASVMPTIPRANTNLTTVAVAERLAELL